ncbi:hypothetical protein CRG98_010498 [Punica granatum]|uniref:Uncharacterized protein n=1 Tax=Punica granatum TaxID=22663 RepID=A0A2I0KKR4_PUNGR|nr:hypothetical protein CRG98_010498 [Punica granatum]
MARGAYFNDDLDVAVDLFNEAIAFNIRECADLYADRAHSRIQLGDFVGVKACVYVRTPYIDTVRASTGSSKG